MIPALFEQYINGFTDEKPPALVKNRRFHAEGALYYWRLYDVMRPPICIGSDVTLTSDYGYIEHNTGDPKRGISRAKRAPFDFICELPNLDIKNHNVLYKPLGPVLMASYGPGLYHPKKATKRPHKDLTQIYDAKPPGSKTKICGK